MAVSSDDEDEIEEEEEGEGDARPAGLVGSGAAAAAAAAAAAGPETSAAAPPRPPLVAWGFYPNCAPGGGEGGARAAGAGDRAEGAALDETDVRWRRKSKHFFILSSSGKPVWSRHGDENALAGFMAVIQALVSFVQGAGDTLRSIELGGGALAVVKVAGPLYLATVSRRRGEGVRALSRQLDLLHLQVMSILTKAVERALARSSRFDMRQLLGGTSHIFRSLCRAMHWELGIGLRAVQAERCDAGLRREVTERLSSVLGRVQAALLLEASIFANLGEPSRTFADLAARGESWRRFADP